jgi:uncharacterized membrane protein (DUF373 family)
MLFGLDFVYVTSTMAQKQRTPLRHQTKISRRYLWNRFDLSIMFFHCFLMFELLLQQGTCQMSKLFKRFREIFRDENFMHLIENIEVVVAKLLSIFMLFVILLSIADLIVFTSREMFIASNYGNFYKTLFKIFGLFLNVLIALEILENITGYLKKHVLQVELVIVTSLIAVARKIIILDLDKVQGMDIVGLGIAILSLSISYFIIRISNSKLRN